MIILFITWYSVSLVDVDRVRVSEDAKMIRLQSAKQLSKATGCAETRSLFVEPTNLHRQYRITNRKIGGCYIVDFFVRKDSKDSGIVRVKLVRGSWHANSWARLVGYPLMRMPEQR
jgi:hypothetical protein